MTAHIGAVHAALRAQATTDPLAELRDALAPMSRATSTDSSTYLGALL